MLPIQVRRKEDWGFMNAVIRRVIIWSDCYFESCSITILAIFIRNGNLESHKCFN